MMTSSNGNIFRVTGLCAGNSPVTSEFPSQRPVTRSFEILFICVWTNGWVNNRDAGDLRRHGGHYDVMCWYSMSHQKYTRFVVLCFVLVIWSVLVDSYNTFTPWSRHQMWTFSRYWPFVRGIHPSPVNSPHKGQWRGTLMFSLIRACRNG